MVLPVGINGGVVWFCFDFVYIYFLVSVAAFLFAATNLFFSFSVSPPLVFGPSTPCASIKYTFAYKKNPLISIPQIHSSITIMLIDQMDN